MTDRTMPIKCPSCSQTLKVARLFCNTCETTVEGSFELSILTSLNPKEQEFVILFLKSRGSLKDLANSYGISYPTVRNRLDEIILKVTNTKNPLGGD